MWRTLIANTAVTYFGSQERASVAYGHTPLALLGASKPLEDFKPIADAHRNLEYGNLLKTAFGRAIDGRRFFVSEKGYFGLAPADVQKGDLTCILAGSPVPFIIRKMEKSFTLVGESCIHGVMDGELVKDMEAIEDEFEEMEIR